MPHGDPPYVYMYQMCEPTFLPYLHSIPDFTPRQGWECPRCGKVHAPWVASCTCHRETETTGPEDDSPPVLGKIDWLNTFKPT